MLLLLLLPVTATVFSGVFSNSPFPLLLPVAKALGQKMYYIVYYENTPGKFAASILFSDYLTNVLDIKFG